MDDGESTKLLPHETSYFTVCYFSLPLLWAKLLFAFCYVAGQVGGSVSLPLWIDSINSVTGDSKYHMYHRNSYFVASSMSFLYCVILGFATLFIKVFLPDKIGETEKNFPTKLLAQTGISNGLSTFLIINASSGTRTAPYLQAILGSFIIPLTVLVRYLILKKKPTLRKFICGILVLIGLFICLLPTIFQKIDPNRSSDLGGATGVGKFLWPLCYMLSYVPAAVMNVIEEKSLKLKNVTSGKGVNLIYFLFWTSLFQFITVGMFFWADIIPGFGNSKNISEFAESWWFGLRCFFGGAGCSATSGTRGAIFVTMYVISFVGGGNLLRYDEGATWLAIVASLVTPLGFIFWTLFKESPFKWHPVAHISTWFSSCALALMVPAIYIYYTGPPEISMDIDLQYDENDCSQDDADHRGGDMNLPPLK